MGRKKVKAEIVKKEAGAFAVHRDGELIGIGMSKEDAENFVSETSEAYPNNVFSIVPGGEVMPGNKGENIDV